MGAGAQAVQARWAVLGAVFGVVGGRGMSICAFNDEGIVRGAVRIIHIEYQRMAAWASCARRGRNWRVSR